MDDLQTRKRNLWFFPLGTVGRDMMYYLFNSCIMTFILFTKSLTNAQFAAVTAIIVGARVFDALNDPIMGNIIERTRSRFGKFKPWLTIGILSCAVVIYLAFNTSLEGWNFVIFFGVIYFLYSITYTMHDIAYWGMVPALSSDANARNQFTSRATLFAGIGSTLAMVLIPILTTGENALGGNATTAYGIVALVICILGVLFQFITIIWVREHRDTKSSAAPFSFRQIIRTILDNDQLRWIAIIFLLQQLGNDLIVGGLGTTYIYFDFGYEGGRASLFSIVGMLPTALLMIFYPAISRRIERKPLLKQMLIIAAAGYVLFLVSVFLPSSEFKFWLVTLGYILSNFGQYCFYLVMMISIINTVEYNEYKLGRRDEAVIASVRPFMTKLASAVVVMVTNLLYLLLKVTSYTNQISDFENQCSRNLISVEERAAGISNVISQISSWKVSGLLLSMAIFPFAMLLISYILYRKHYTLDEAEYLRICKELEP